MRLITFADADGTVLLGAFEEGDLSIVQLTGQHPCLDSMQDLIEAGDEGLRVAKAAKAAKAAPRVATQSVTLLSPLPKPEQYRDFMMFEEHFKNCKVRAMEDVLKKYDESERAKKRQDAIDKGHTKIPGVWYKQPIYYKGNRFAFQGHEADVEWPSYSTKQRDFECEMAVIIGKVGKDIPKESAMDHVFGFSILNDFSARDAQFSEMAASLGPCKGKDFDGANVMGPCIVTKDEFGDYKQKTMEAFVNGERWGGGTAGNMHFGFEGAIAHVSKGETLHPGEVLGSGTVGTGCGFEHGRYLNDGDEVELRIEGIGSLRNRVVLEPKAKAATAGAKATGARKKSAAAKSGEWAKLLGAALAGAAVASIVLLNSGKAKQR